MTVTQVSFCANCLRTKGYCMLVLADARDRCSFLDVFRVEAERKVIKTK